MRRNVVLIAAILLSLSITATSGAMAMPTNTVTILPTDCKMLVGEEISFSLDGFISPNAIVSWEASRGGITSVMPGRNALFIAPSEPELVTISVFISGGRGTETLITRECIVKSLNQAPSDLAQGPDVVISSITSLRFPIDELGQASY
jgi:hypothetical protein